MTPTAARVLKAVTDALATRALDECEGGTVSVVVQLDRSGCVRRVVLRTEVASEVDMKRPGERAQTM